MGGVFRNCMQSMMKAVNSGIAMVGVAMILYGVWLARVWQRQMGHLPFGDSDFPAAWFIYTSLALGITFCVVAFSGHIAAETANGCCLLMYMVFVFLILMVEAGVVADIFLNREWELDFPEDPTGTFDELKNFIRSNFDICKWIGLSVLSIQGFSLFFALVLRAVGRRQDCDSDDEDSPVRTPLLMNGVEPFPYGDSNCRSNNEAWHIRINDRTSR